MNPSGIYLGLMSGTSADGLDIAFCQIDGPHELQLAHSYYAAYPETLRKQIIKLQLEPTLQTAELSSLDQQLASFVSQQIKLAIAETDYDMHAIQAVANHGQTIQHQPNAKPPFSLQIGNAQQIANLTQLTVIADFRRADIEHGGQGAPLMPAFHQQIFASHAPCTVINIGGIANITTIDVSTGDTIGFDTGPGNTLLNHWVSKHQQKPFDDSGSWARTGQLETKLLDNMLADRYFHSPHPKSTGQDYFNPKWLDQLLAKHPATPNENVQYTLTALTAASIANEVKQLNYDNRPAFICGGGVHNTLLCELLNAYLPNCTLQTSAEASIDPDWVEAMGFAWLGYCRLAGVTSNLPSVTGATKRVLLGDIFHPTNT